MTMRSQAEGRTRTRLAELVAALLAAGQQLEKTLEEERQALLRQDSTAISALADLKHRQVEELEALERTRRDLCNANGNAGDPEQMPALLAACGADDGMVRGWHQVLSLALRCRDQNTINGAVIRLRRRQFSAALRIVRGVATDASDSYDPTGAGVTPGASRPLAEA